MAVLVEGISIVVRRDSIDAKYEGGWDAFLDDLPTSPFCHDDEIACVMFMSYLNADTYVDFLETKGLVFLEDGHSIDIAVVDQDEGAKYSTYWLQFVHKWFPVEGADDKVSGCWFLERNPLPDSGGVVLPGGFEIGGGYIYFSTPSNWRYETSLSKNHTFYSEEELRQKCKFLRSEGLVDVYLNTETGKELYVARPILEGETERAMISRLNHICHEVLNIEKKMNSLDPVWDKEDLEDCTERLRIGLLPMVREMAEKTCRHISFSHHVLGLILRRLRRFHEAEAAFREAERIQPDEVGNLMELVCCLIEEHEYEDALNYAQKVVDLSPENAGAWGNLALCLMRCGYITKARDAIDRAMQIDPADKINQHLQNHLNSSVSNAEPPGPMSEESWQGLMESDN